VRRWSAEAQHHRPHPQRQQLWDDPLETGEHGFKDWGLTYDNPWDFVNMPKVMRLGHRVTSAEMVPGLLRHLASTRPKVLIDCPVDYVDNDQLNKEIAN
jgi:hypothetical protein